MARLAYIAHPLGSSIGHESGSDAARRANLEEAERWVEWAARQGVIPIAPWVTLARFWPERMRDVCIALNNEALRRCDEFWACGPRISEGMERQKRVADLHGLVYRRWEQRGEDVFARLAVSEQTLRAEPSDVATPDSFELAARAHRLTTEKATLHRRVVQQRRQLSAQNAAYWTLQRRATELAREGWMVRHITEALANVSMFDLEVLASSGGQGIGQLCQAAVAIGPVCRFETERRRRWEQHGLGSDPRRFPSAEAPALALEATG